MNKEKLIEVLQEKTCRSKEECLLINDVLEKHFIVGRNNKKKIILDFVDRLHIEYKEANQLYNVCMESILNGFMRS